MKKFFLTLIIVLFSGAMAHGQADSLRRAIAEQQGKDKIESYHRLMLTLYDTADLQEWTAFLEEYEAVLLREKRQERDTELISHYAYRYGMMKLNHAYFLYNLRDYQTVEKEVRAAMEFCYEHDEKNLYYRFFDMLLEILDLTLQHETLQSETLKLYESAKVKNDNFGMAIAAFSLARFYKNQSRWAEAEKYYRDCINLFVNSNMSYTSMRDNLTEARRFLCYTLIYLEKYDEVLQALSEFEQEAIKHNASLNEKDNFDPFMSRHNRINLSMYYVYYYLAIGDIDAAERYCEIAENMILTYKSDYTPFHSHFYQLQAQMFAASERYDKALVAIDIAINANSKTPTNFLAVRTLLNYKTRYMIHAGKATEAIALYDSLRILDRQACLTEINAQLDEIRTIYEVDKITAEKERIRKNLILAIAGCILLTITVLITVYYSRIVRNKNQGLFLQIKEQDGLKEELLKERKDKINILKRLQTYGKHDLSKEDQLVNDEMNIFVRLETMMTEQLLYTKKDINRIELADKLKITEKELINSIKDSVGMTFIDYINDLRLDHAKKLLLSPENHKIEVIAQTVGFITREWFHKTFKEQFQLTPDEFRNSAKALLSATQGTK